MKIETIHLNERDQLLTVRLTNGGIVLKYAWFPRLAHASDEQRESHHVINDGRAVRWTLLGFTLSLKEMLQVLNTRHGLLPDHKQALDEMEAQDGRA